MRKNIGILALGGTAALGLAFGIGTRVGNEEKPTSGASSHAIVRELRCEEDEDIVVTLAGNGLPLAFCEQVIER